MRKAIYRAILAAPFRVSGAGIGIAGFVSSVWPDKVKAVIGGNSVTIQGVGITLLSLAVVYFIALWLLKPGESGAKQNSGVTNATHGATSPIEDNAASTTGPHSHALAGTFGDVHLYSPPAPTSERKAPPLPDTAPARPHRQKSTPKADLPLTDLMRRLYDQLPGAKNDAEARELFRKVDLQILDAVVDHKLHIWGRVENYARRLISPVEMEFATMNNVRGELTTHSYSDGGDVYTDLMFNKAEIDRVWPEPLKTTAEVISHPSRAMPSTVEGKFADPYREAVLSLIEAKVTKMAGSGGPGITAVECDLILTGKVVLQECRVWLGELRTDSSVERIDSFVRTGRKEGDSYPNTFMIHRPGAPARMRLIGRDLKDVISNPPFLLYTDKGNYPLEDSTNYHLEMELRSEAKYPTKVTLLIATGNKDVLETVIEAQTV